MSRLHGTNDVMSDDGMLHAACRYGWGRNAPELHLPPGVAFSVGGGTNIRYMVAQVHYKADRPANDYSGTRLFLVPQPTPFSAGVMTYASWFSIPPRTPLYRVPAECCYQGHQALTTIAFRVHAHALGRRIYMERPKWDDPSG